MQLITSENNPNLKKAIRLHQSRGRRQQGRIIIFGINEITRAQQCQVEFEDIFVCNEGLSGPSRKLVQLLQAESNSRLFQVLPGLFRKLAFGGRSDGVIAVARRPATDLEKFQPAAESLVLVLETIEKPGNIGAVFRSADAAGVDAVFLADPLTDVFHPNAIRSSLGSVFSIPVVCESNSSIRIYLTANKFSIIATRVDVQKSIFDIDLTCRTAIVLGNESRGLSDAWTGTDCTAATIPMRGRADSLNIAMTSTIMVFEALRQRSNRA